MTGRISTLFYCLAPSVIVNTLKPCTTQPGCRPGEKYTVVRTIWAPLERSSLDQNLLHYLTGNTIVGAVLFDGWIDIVGTGVGFSSVRLVGCKLKVGTRLGRKVIVGAGENVGLTKDAFVGRAAPGWINSTYNSGGKLESLE